MPGIHQREEVCGEGLGALGRAWVRGQRVHCEGEGAAVTGQGQALAPRSACCNERRGSGLTYAQGRTHGLPRGLRP